MNRRRLLQIIAGLPLAKSLLQPTFAAGQTATPTSRVRPGDPAWPSEASWEQLDRDVAGRLIKVHSPLAACVGATSDAACAEVFKELKNPYYIGDEVGLTQTLGWVDGWTSRPSVYAVAAETAADVATAIDFARKHNLRVVVKGGGHSYMGGSNAPDSLLIWTRKMTSIALHDAFVGAGCAGIVAPTPAVTVGAGAIWGHVYNEVTTKAGRYVQGGGCLTVGVPGLILGGGFGSFSKAYGLAAASLLEAEIVTADGAIRIANRCANPDLFWALKAGGGGFGVVTQVTLRTHELPQFFGAVFATIKATSDESYRLLVGKIVDFYAKALFNPHWGEQLIFKPGALEISMLFQGLDRQQAEAVWRPFFDWVAAAPQDFTYSAPPNIVAVPAQYLWDPAGLKRAHIVLADDREGAPEDNIFWAGNQMEAGWVVHAYQTAWLPASLLEADRREKLGDALYSAAKLAGHYYIALHINKGLAGAPAEAIAAAKDTAMNPAVVDAFALAFGVSAEQPAYPGVPRHEPDVATARNEAAAVDQAMNEFRKLVPSAGAYVWESNFFQANWQQSYFGENYTRLREVKAKYDPDGLFFLHHGVGSEDWSADGFTRLS
jgi:FAD/FMN-containing dehydrogenase